MTYPANPPPLEEIIAVMRQAGERRHRLRIRAVIAVLWRAGLRISQALTLSETPYAANYVRSLPKQVPRQRFAPHELKHAHAVELAREGVPVNIIAARSAWDCCRSVQHVAGVRERPEPRRRGASWQQCYSSGATTRWAGCYCWWQRSSRSRPAS